MNLSQEGLNYLKRKEGLPGGRPALVAYQDIKKVWTIGYGHTEGVTKDMTITEHQAEELLKFDTEWAVSAVVSLVKVVLSQSQFDALVSLVLNIGTTQFSTSTLLKLLNRGQSTEAGKQFDVWNKITNPVTKKKEVNQGLVNRRRMDRAIFDSADYYSK